MLIRTELYWPRVTPFNTTVTTGEQIFNYFQYLNIPVQILEIIENLFSGCHSCIKWGDSWSVEFSSYQHNTDHVINMDFVLQYVTKIWIVFFIFPRRSGLPIHLDCRPLDYFCSIYVSLATYTRYAVRRTANVCGFYRASAYGCWRAILI